MATILEEITKYRGILNEGSDRPSLADQIQTELIKSKKVGNATRLFYYLQAQKKNLSALADYETFIKSWAGQEWLKKHQAVIEALAKDENNFLSGQGLRKKWFADTPNNIK